MRKPSVLVLGVLVGLFLFALSLAPSFAAAPDATVSAYNKNLTNDPHANFSDAYFLVYLADCALSVDVGESRDILPWDCFYIQYESSSDNWIIETEYSYTDTDSDGAYDSLQATLTGCDTAGGKCIIYAIDYDGI